MGSRLVLPIRTFVDFIPLFVVWNIPSCRRLLALTAFLPGITRTFQFFNYATPTSDHVKARTLPSVSARLTCLSSSLHHRRVFLHRPPLVLYPTFCSEHSNGTCRFVAPSSCPFGKFCFLGATTLPPTSSSFLCFSASTSSGAILPLTLSLLQHPPAYSIPRSLIFHLASTVQSGFAVQSAGTL